MDFTEKKDVKQETVPETITVEELRMKILEEVMDLMCEKAKRICEKASREDEEIQNQFQKFKSRGVLSRDSSFYFWREIFNVFYETSYVLTFIFLEV